MVQQQMRPHLLAQSKTLMSAKRRKKDINIETPYNIFVLVCVFVVVILGSNYIHKQILKHYYKQNKILQASLFTRYT